MSEQKMNGEKVILITKIGRMKKVMFVNEHVYLFICLIVYLN